MQMGALTVGELDLDLDAFEGPFDLLLTLVLRDELPLREVDLAEIVIAFLQHLEERGRLDLDSCGEFLVLISALLELKARGLFPDEDAELAELEPEVAAEELARRLAEYRRAKEGAEWLAARLEAAAARYFRLGPPPLAPSRPEPSLGSQPPEALAAALRGLAAEPPLPSTAHMALEFPPVTHFVERWRSLLRRRTRLDFDQEVEGLERVEIAVAFLAVLELAKQRELEISQASPFAPIRINRAGAEMRDGTEEDGTWIAHSG
jgi:segregation and condensation protein A